MDYRKPVVFGENWSPSRYKVLPYFEVERALLREPQRKRILEIGCANGWNMSRFNQYGRDSVGVDMVPERVKLASLHGPALLASGLSLPFRAASFDMVYVQHVLHHIGDIQTALAEARRVLEPGGLLFLIETIDDSPIIRWGRRLYPHWLGDEVNAPFSLAGLQAEIAEGGFEVLSAEPYSVLFWMWEILPDQLPFMERLTPAAVTVEQILARYLARYSAHCFLVARKL